MQTRGLLANNSVAKSQSRKNKILKCKPAGSLQTILWPKVRVGKTKYSNANPRASCKQFCGQKSESEKQNTQMQTRGLFANNSVAKSQSRKNKILKCKPAGFLQT